MDESGPYIAGKELSLADATVFPTLIFVEKMMPFFEENGTNGWVQEKVFGKKLNTWFEWIKTNDEVLVCMYVH